MPYTYVVHYRSFEGDITIDRTPDGLNIQSYGAGQYSTTAQFLLLESEKPLKVLEVVKGFARKHQGEKIPSLEALVPKLEEDYGVKVRVPDGEVRITTLNDSIV
ncbi:MAG: hypothetical protein ISS23_03260 [Nanoarchaeota archaeon]|nr:hypothetical protein [Nanoarchaeota archaeon]